VVTPQPGPATPVVVPLDRRLGWILRLEDERRLRDEAAAPGPSAASAPDLIRLVADADPAVRRRAAIAIGRVGAADGVPALTTALGDADAEVREAAAFALGLVGSKTAVPALTAALADASIRVRGRAADALGLIGDASAAPAVAEMASGCGPVLAPIEPDDERWPMAPEIEACRLALFSLVRLKQYEALARVAIDARGQPVSRWWPVAYALQRLPDKRAVPALVALASTSGVYTPAFAFSGLARLKDAEGASLARATVARRDADVRLRVAAMRLLAAIRDTASVDRLAALVADDATPPNLALEATIALGAIGDRKAFDPLADLFVHKWPALRAAALAAAAKVDPDAFLLIAPGMGPDRDWSVRAAMAGIFAALPGGRVRTAVAELASDTDARVAAAGLSALAKIGAPDLPERLNAALAAPDFALRAAAATLIGQMRPADGVSRLTSAYARGQSDATGAARAAALEALARYGGDDARQTLRAALADPDWPVRERAADLLHTLGDAGAQPARPAATRQPAAFFEGATLLHPAYAPHAFIETRYGSIEIELNLVDSPQTTLSFVELARKGFFNGMRIHRVVPNFVVQAGDARGDGEGGPGYSLRDELSPTPFLRGTVGMALSTQDTGGSQFFITVSPQPHLDGKYTVFGRVVKGFEVLDQLSQWDVIDRVRIWDGVSFE
jgi:cyclophilin family peptidyl-prolyl cis-trans isomerase/HEAT repeat protein